MISQQEYAKRRQQLLAEIGTGNIGILASASEILRNGDSPYPYRQNSDFYYLTGFNEPEAVAVFVPGHNEGEFILFCRDRDPAKEIWDGARAGTEGAVKDFGADQAFSISQLDEMIPQLLEGREQLFYAIGRDIGFDELVVSWLDSVRSKIRSGVNAPETFTNIEKIIHEMRLIKSDSEIALMREAARISSQAHLKAMQACKAGINEYELEALLNYEFAKNGSRFPAYTSIVGSGANTCILHYIDNNAELKDGDLLLIDAGGEYKNYASDITRTFPVNGKYSEQQKAIYQLVLQAQLAGIDKAKAGVVWTEIQDTMVKIITEGLVGLDLLQGDVDKLIEEQSYKKFYMHNSGHWLGLDVHDAGSYKEDNQWRKLQAGMVLTVEPGIYIAADKDVDKQWWNIGVRIEDDVLVTNGEPEVLSGELPKTIEEIEAVMSQK